MSRTKVPRSENKVGLGCQDKKFSIPFKSMFSSAGHLHHVSRHREIDAKAKILRVKRCREFDKNEALSGDASKICLEFPTF